MATYNNNLALTELATGEGAGTWGATTNTNLESIAESLGRASLVAFTTNANTTVTLANGTGGQALRALNLEITSSVTLTVTRVLTLAPNTVSRVQFIKNSTTGSQSIEISQGSGANVTIPNGQTKLVYFSGTGAASLTGDVLDDLSITGNINIAGTVEADGFSGTGALTITDFIDDDTFDSATATNVPTAESVKAYIAAQGALTDTLAEILAIGNTTGGTDIVVSSGDKIVGPASGTAAPYLLLQNGSGAQGVYMTSSDGLSKVWASETDVSLYHSGGDNPGRKLQTTNTGIDVTGNVKGDSLTIDNGAGLTTAYVNSATGASILTVKSTYEGGTEWQNVGAIEVGGHDKAYIDLKKPDTDDTDLRLLHDGDGSLTAFSGDLLLQTTTANSGGKVALVNGGNTRLETTSTGIDVTGTVTADGVALGNNEKITLGGESSGKLEIYEATGGNGVIEQTGAGDIVVKGANGSLRNDSNDALVAWDNARAEFYWRGATGAGAKLATTETGIDVTGSMTATVGIKVGGSNVMSGVSTDLTSVASSTSLATSLAIKTYVDASGGNETLAQTLVLGNSTGGTNIAVDDDDRIVLGAGSDLQIYHSTALSGQNYIVAGAATPSLTLGASNGGSVNLSVGGGARVVVDVDGLKTNSGVISSQAGYNVNVQAAVGYGVRLTSSGGVSRFYATETQAQLFYGATAAAGTKVLETTATGIDVTGTVTADAIKFTTDATDNAKIFTELTGATTALVIQSLDDGDDSIVLRSHNAGVGAVDVLVATKTGIDVTGTVDLDNLTIAAAQGTAGQVLKSTGSGIEWGSDSGGSETLAQTLALGNTTGGTDLSVSAADDLLLTASSKIIASNGLTGVDKRELQFYVDGAANGISKIEAPNNHLNITSGSWVQMGGSSGFPIVRATADTASLYHGTGAGVNLVKLETTSAGIDVTGDLDVTGTITSNAFAYSKATVNNAADIAYTAFNSFAGKRIINTASATATTYGLPTPVAADIGKSWIICNPTDSLITIDHDASGTANYVWIMDGVTLSAAASSWSIKRGAVVEIVVAAAAVGGGGLQAPNYLIFGAGLLEL